MKPLCSVFFPVGVRQLNAKHLQPNVQAEESTQSQCHSCTFQWPNMFGVTVLVIYSDPSPHIDDSHRILKNAALSFYSFFFSLEVTEKRNTAGGYQYIWYTPIRNVINLIRNSCLIYYHIAYNNEKNCEKENLFCMKLQSSSICECMCVSHAMVTLHRTNQWNGMFPFCCSVTAHRVVGWWCWCCRSRRTGWKTHCRQSQTDGTAGAVDHTIRPAQTQLPCSIRRKFHSFIINFPCFSYVRTRNAHRWFQMRLFSTTDANTIRNITSFCCCCSNSGTACDTKIFISIIQPATF